MPGVHWQKKLHQSTDKASTEQPVVSRLAAGRTGHENRCPVGRRPALTSMFCLARWFKVTKLKELSGHQTNFEVFTFCLTGDGRLASKSRGKMFHLRRKRQLCSGRRQYDAIINRAWLLWWMRSVSWWWNQSASGYNTMIKTARSARRGWLWMATTERTTPSCLYSFLSSHHQNPVVDRDTTKTSLLSVICQPFQHIDRQCITHKINIF
jgi:hypothetical protein